MSTVRKELVIEASREQVWEYISQPERIAEWLMESNFVPEVGAEFVFRGEPNEEWDGKIYCRVLEVEAKKKIAFTWDANDIQGETIVLIELEDSENNSEQTLLRLTHSNFEAAVLDTQPIIDRHETGWSRHLDILRDKLG